MNTSSPLPANSIELLDSFSQISATEWNALVAHTTPLLAHEFFVALEASKSVGAKSGWQPYPLIVKAHDTVIGAIPLFLKNHSYGEYVFDWAWADAYQQNGVAYYPKLVSAIPFSPITSPRLLAADDDTKMQMIEALETVLIQHRLSSAHILFPDEASATCFEAAGWLRRNGVQFCWENQAYSDFESFLQTLSHDKRKKIHQERKKIRDNGVVCRAIKGADICEEDWDFFYQCYCNTYEQHYSTPYLTRQFFSLIGAAMPQRIVLFVAEISGRPIASALNFYNETTLYGRYWGATEYISSLHFELCYYQAQQFCIEEKIRYFEGGAQGEHKLARGFKPRPTCSYHKIVHPEFEHAIRDFLRRESVSVAAYTNELEERAPFKFT